MPKLAPSILSVQELAKRLISNASRSSRFFQNACTFPGAVRECMRTINVCVPVEPISTNLWRHFADAIKRAEWKNFPDVRLGYFAKNWYQWTRISCDPDIRRSATARELEEAHRKRTRGQTSFPKTPVGASDAEVLLAFAQQQIHVTGGSDFHLQSDLKGKFTSFPSKI